MKIKKAFVLGFTLTLLTVTNAWTIPESVDLAPTKNLMGAAQPLPYIYIPTFEPQTPAYKQYKRRPSSELSKLIYLGDLLKHSDLTIVHHGKSYQPRAIAGLITTYVRLNYKKETAADWIVKHAYRTGTSYSIIYVKDPDGTRTVLRDLLLEELKQL